MWAEWALLHGDGRLNVSRCARHAARLMPVRVTGTWRTHGMEADNAAKMRRVHSIDSDQAERRLRPLARRALMILRPPTVFMRARKPWLRARLRLLGWNVRFMATPYEFG